MVQDRGTFWQKISGFARLDKPEDGFTESQLPDRLRKAGSSPLDVQRKKDYFIRCQELRALRRLMQQKSWAESDSANSRHTAPASALSRDETLRRITEIEAAFRGGPARSTPIARSPTLAELTRPPMEMFEPTQGGAPHSATDSIKLKVRRNGAETKALSEVAPSTQATLSTQTIGTTQGPSQLATQPLNAPTAPITQRLVQGDGRDGLPVDSGLTASSDMHAISLPEGLLAADAAQQAQPPVRDRSSKATLQAGPATVTAAGTDVRKSSSSKSSSSKSSVSSSSSSSSTRAARKGAMEGGHDLTQIRNRTIDDAAAAYSKGDDEGARKALEEAIKPGEPLEKHLDTWKTYFDLLRLTGDAAGFSREAKRFVSLTGASFPRWNVKRTEEKTTPKGGLVSPALLDAAFANNLLAAIGLASTSRGMDIDFSALTRVRSAGFQPLARAFKSLLSFAGEVRMVGVDTLLEVLGEATPPGDKEIDPVRWEARLLALRMLNREVDYEFAGLDYAATFNISPAPFKTPAVRVLPQATSGKSASSSSAYSSFRLTGSITGSRREFLAPLASVESMQGRIEIDLQELQRMDYPSAVVLRDWIRGLAGQGKEVVFSNANRLIAVLLSVAGVTSHAEVRLLDT